MKLADFPDKFDPAVLESPSSFLDAATVSPEYAAKWEKVTGLAWNQARWLTMGLLLVATDEGQLVLAKLRSVAERQAERERTEARAIDDLPITGHTTGGA